MYCPLFLTGRGVFKRFRSLLVLERDSSLIEGLEGVTRSLLSGLSLGKEQRSSRKSHSLIFYLYMDHVEMHDNNIFMMGTNINL